jgi:hypothetical protein
MQGVRQKLRELKKEIRIKFKKKEKKNEKEENYMVDYFNFILSSYFICSYCSNSIISENKELKKQQEEN